MSFLDKLKAKKDPAYEREYQREYKKVRGMEIRKKARTDARAKARISNEGIFSKINRFGKGMEKLDKNLERAFGGAPTKSKRKNKDPMSIIYGD